MSYHYTDVRLKSQDEPNESDEYLVWKMKTKTNNSSNQGSEGPINVEALFKLLWMQKV